MENSKKKTGLVLLSLFLLLAALLVLNKGELEPGSNEWCHKLEDTPKVEWTADDLRTFTHYCIGRNL